MAKRERPKKVSRISPKIPPQESGVVYGDLKDGDCFLCQNALWIKSDCGSQEAVNLANGGMGCDFCEQGNVIPVDIKVTWTKK